MTGLVSQEGLGWLHVYLGNLPGIMQVLHRIPALKEGDLSCWRFVKTHTHKNPRYLRPTKNLLTFFTRVRVFTSDGGRVPYKVATGFFSWPIHLSILNRKHKSSCEVLTFSSRSFVHSLKLWHMSWQQPIFLRRPGRLVCYPTKHKL